MATGRGVRFDGAGLREDLRASWKDASAALVLTLAIFALLYWRVADGSSATIEVMPFLADAPLYWMYWLCQAFGWSGLLWAWITVMLGLVRSSRRPAWMPVSTARLERWHRTTSLTTIGLMFAHAFWFFAELVRENADGLSAPALLWSAFVDVFVLGGYSSGTGRIAILIGLLALYLSIPLGLAFYARRWMGPRVWQALHASIIVVYVLSVWHTLLYGTNVWYDGAFRTTIWLFQLPVAGLLLVRLLASARTPGRSRLDAVGRWVGRLAVSATIVVVLLVTTTGRDGGRTPGVDGAGLNVTQVMVWAGLVLFVAGVTVTIVRARRRR
ncbi:iron reductase [Nocardia donostiensis]|uniref:ferric reductase-like transmembrane domain-containing protein n=1 Tax=Nocardia donostiensis TaxID=1538463 RepID=UPI0009DA1CD4|nr:ferric reductase-like transmembrane domain-containing protein [Nocardia donostiensis]OQS12336.1 iron reductase [Nocardia donostiensis]